ncbi:MAG: PhoD-like phosphatase N-terminal domain-containing protein, partial [Fuerstiella sp.]
MPRRLLLLLAAFLLCRDGIAQQIPDYDLGGASKPRPDMSFRKENQYKRVHQSSLRFILRGDLDRTEQFLDQYLAEHPDDAETLYMLGILHGQRGNIPTAEDFLKRAIAAGLPDDRIIAGPRDMITPLLQTELLKNLMSEFRTRLVHGPLLGNVSGTSASFWVRTARESDIQITVQEASPGSRRLTSDTVRSAAAEDYTAVATVTGLKPDTEYHYSVILDGADCAKQGPQKFRTLPAAGTPSQFVIAFGGGAGYVPEHERMWDTIRHFDPHAILLLGDNVYIDDP